MADASGAVMAANPYAGLMTGVGKGLQGAMTDTASTSSSVATYGTQHGGTGWVINFGDGNVSSEATNKQTSTNPSSQPGGGGLADTYGLTSPSGGISPALIAAGIVIAALIVRLLRKGH